MAKIVLIGLYDNWALGLRTLSNALVSKGHEVSIINFKLASGKELDDFLKYPLHYENAHSNASTSRMILTGYGIDINMWSHNEIELLGDLLEDIRPDIIGLSTRSIYEDCNYIDQIMEKMKRVSSAVTIAGGYGATFTPSRYIEILDYACVGEGEDALIKMAEFVDKDKKEEIKKISNLVYKQNNEIVINKMEPPSDSEDHWFNKAMSNVKRYVIEDNIIREGKPFIKDILEQNPSYAGEYYTMVGRGCLWDCSFCSAGRFYELYQENDVNLKKRRLRSIEAIINELKWVKEKFHFKKVFFMDSYFFASRPYLMEFFELYKQEVGLPFFAQFFSPQILKHPEILKSAYEAGLAHTVLGIQSGSDRITREVMNRGESNQELIEFANLVCQCENVLLDYHLITHNPFEKEKDINKTFDFLSKLPKENAQLVLLRLRPFRTSRIERMIKSSNLDTLKNMERDKRNFMLYLIRFYSLNETFDEIMSRIDNYSFEDLKNIYSNVRKEYDANFPLYSRMGSSSNPILIQEYKGFNVVLYKRKFLALFQGLGSIDLTRIEDGKLLKYQKERKCLIGKSLEDVKEVINIESLR